MPQKFEDLNIDMQTVMIHTNIEIDLEKLFSKIPITQTDPELDKKGKIDKKKLKAPYGAIIGINLDGKYRGIALSGMDKKFPCPRCQEIKSNGQSESDPNISQVCDYAKTVIPILEKADEDEQNSEGDIHVVRYRCQECNHSFRPDQLGKIVRFLNQLNTIISIGDILINIMVFKSSMKLVGCTCSNTKEKDGVHNFSFDNAIKALILFWEEYIYRNHGEDERVWKFRKDIEYNDECIENGLLPKKQVQFLFVSEMANRKANVNHDIDLKNLVKILNDDEERKICTVVQYDNTRTTHVSIKSMCNSSEWNYDVLIYNFDRTNHMKLGNLDLPKPKFVKIKENIYKNDKKKDKFTTVLIRKSGKIFISGKHNENIKTLYEYLLKIIEENKSSLYSSVLPSHKSKKSSKRRKRIRSLKEIFDDLGELENINIDKIKINYIEK